MSDCNHRRTFNVRRVHRPRWGVVCMLLSIVFFSANALTLKHLAQSDISPWIALLFRAVVGMVIITVMFRLNGQVSFRRATTDRMLAYRGLLGVLGTISYYLTVPELGAGKATLIGNTYVVIAALMAVWFLREKFSARKLAGNALAFLGLTLLIASPSQTTLFGWYETLAVFGAFMSAGTVVVIRKLTLTESTAMIMTEGFRHLTIAVGGAFQICVPVVIAVGGVLLFGESFTIAQLFGAVLILCGCYLVMQFR